VRWDVALGRAAGQPPRLLRPGGQVLALTNDYDREVVVRVERAAARADALTAARASALELFRELFPEETLSPGQLVSVATVTLLVTDLEGAGELYAERGDAGAFGLLHEHFRRLRDRVRGEGGALVKTVGEGAVAAFTDPAAAVRAALALPDLLPPDAPGLRPRAGVHRGAALAATVNDHLDYFGAAVRQALALPALARGGELVLTEATAGDPQVAALLRERGLCGELFEAALPDGPCLAQRFALPAPGGPEGATSHPLSAAAGRRVAGRA
jgi:class 3 adenylate cyclase